MKPLRLTRLEVDDLRNLSGVALEPSPRFNVIAGENGQGKTNLLEAIFALCTARSFRTHTLGDVIRHGAELAALRGIFDDGDVTRRHVVGLKRGARVVRVDDHRPKSLAEYAVLSPVVVFHPGELELTMGSAGVRRRYVDRIVAYGDRAYLAELEAYVRALRERQEVLATRGPQASDLRAWEELVVRHGLSVMERRARGVAAISPAASAAFETIAAPGLRVDIAYERSAPTTHEAFLAALHGARGRDQHRGSASFGPHRDDLRIDLEGREARHHASQGQHRALTLALKAAEIQVIAQGSGHRPLLLLDDVSSELDRERTAALFRFLRAHDGQVFLTTTRPELIDTSRATLAEGALGGTSNPPSTAGTNRDERLDFVVERGVVRVVS